MQHPDDCMAGLSSLPEALKRAPIRRAPVHPFFWGMLVGCHFLTSDECSLQNFDLRSQFHKSKKCRFGDETKAA
jgi:hypothetical protein